MIHQVMSTDMASTKRLRPPFLFMSLMRMMCKGSFHPFSHSTKMRVQLVSCIIRGWYHSNDAMRCFGEALKIQWVLQAAAACRTCTTCRDDVVPTIWGSFWALLVEWVKPSTWASSPWSQINALWMQLCPCCMQQTGPLWMLNVECVEWCMDGGREKRTIDNQSLPWRKFSK